MTATITSRRKTPKAAYRLEDIGEAAARYTLHEHARERCGERNINVREVYSAIDEPDVVTPDKRHPDRLHFKRGDLTVVVGQKEALVITVMLPGDTDDSYRYHRTPVLDGTFMAVGKPVFSAAEEANNGKQTGTSVAVTTVSEPDTPDLYLRQPLLPINGDLAPLAPRPAPRAPDAKEMALQRAWCLLKTHKRQDYRLIYLTPDLAKEIRLRTNKHNRPLSEASVRRWEDIIRAGAWATTHQGIAIARGAVLNDGQHRLRAIERAGRAVEIWVMTGDHPENFAVIDCGRKRSASDAIAIEMGLDKVPANVAPAMRLIYLAINHDIKTWRRVAFPPVVALAAYRGADHDNLNRAMETAHRCGKLLSLVPSSTAAAYYLIARMNPDHLDAVDAFFGDMVAYKQGSALEDVRLAFVRALDEDARAKVRPRGLDFNVQRLAQLLQVWQVYATGAEVPARKRGAIITWDGKTMPPVARVGDPA